MINFLGTIEINLSDLRSSCKIFPNSKPIMHIVLIWFNFSQKNCVRLHH